MLVAKTFRIKKKEITLSRTALAKSPCDEYTALWGVPARRGSGQAKKRRESVVLAWTIFVATCLGARGRLSPAFSKTE